MGSLETDWQQTRKTVKPATIQAPPSSWIGGVTRYEPSIACMTNEESTKAEATMKKKLPPVARWSKKTTRTVAGGRMVANVEPTIAATWRKHQPDGWEKVGRQVGR